MKEKLQHCLGTLIKTNSSKTIQERSLILAKLQVKNSTFGWSKSKNAKFCYFLQISINHIILMSKKALTKDQLVFQIKKSNKMQK